MSGLIEDSWILTSLLYSVGLWYFIWQKCGKISWLTQLGREGPQECPEVLGPQSRNCWLKWLIRLKKKVEEKAVVPRPLPARPRKLSILDLWGCPTWSWSKEIPAVTGLTYRPPAKTIWLNCPQQFYPASNFYHPGGLERFWKKPASDLISAAIGFELLCCVAHP